MASKCNVCKSELIAIGIKLTGDEDKYTNVLICEYCYSLEQEKKQLNLNDNEET